ncbi:MAG: NAD(P)H-dependent oxidoreductase [Xanthomonadales bacterium]|nr:NAD(P)H-dependent oxidoreductase [Xanthomonadales bacterium]
MNDTIAIFASARRDGNTGKFIDWIASELDIKIIDISEKNISAFDYQHKNLNDDFLPLINQLLEYKNILFVTPVYWYAASAQMKVFIDRTSDLLSLEELKDTGRGLRNISAYIVCTSTSPQADPSFLTAFKNTFEYLGMNYAGHVHANCENGYKPEEYRDSVNNFVRLVEQR